MSNHIKTTLVAGTPNQVITGPITLYGYTYLTDTSFTGSLFAFNASSTTDVSDPVCSIVKPAAVTPQGQSLTIAAPAGSPGVSMQNGLMVSELAGVSASGTVEVVFFYDVLV